MPHQIVTTVTLAAAVANGIALAQALGAAGPLTLNGSTVTSGVAVLDAARRVIITSVGNDSGIIFTIAGTRGAWWALQAVTETVTGANAGTVVSTQDFVTVTSITASGATAGNVTAGTNGTGSGPWVVWDDFIAGFNVSLYGAILAGAPTWTVEYTHDDVFGLWLPPGLAFPRALPFTTMTNLTVSADGAFNSRVMASRLTLSAVGSVQLTQQQQGGAV